MGRRVPLLVLTIAAVVAVVAAAAQAVPAALAAAGGVEVRLAGEARYRASERLFGRPFREPVGRTGDVTGTVVIDAAGGVALVSPVRVGLGDLTSDEPLRDYVVRTTVLDTGRYPVATFAPTAVRGAPPAWPAGGRFDVEIEGVLTVRDVARTVVWVGVVAVDGDTATLEATLRTAFTELGMEPPRVGTLVEVDDALVLEVTFRLQRHD